MRPCLVVYYSRTGVTARIAQEIAGQCGADVDVIREERSRAGPLGFLRSAYESIRRKQPAIRVAEKDPYDYATVVLGTPVWAGHMSAPMRSYLMRHRDRLHRVALFCTMGGSGGRQTLDEMAVLCGKAPIAAVALSDAEIRDGNYAAKLGALANGAQAIIR